MPKKKNNENKKLPLWFENMDEPFQNLMKMEEQIHKMMKDMWERPLSYSFARAMETPFGLKHKFLRGIPIDLAETDNELIAKADLPGFNKEDIKLKITENTMEIAAEKKKESIVKEKNFYRQERSYGSARRVVSLPVEINPDKVKAKFENGVLTVTMKKVEPKKKFREIKPE